MRNILIILVSLNVFYCNAQRYVYNGYSKEMLEISNNVFLNFKDVDSLKFSKLQETKEGLIFFEFTDCNINILNGTKSNKVLKGRKHDLLFFTRVYEPNAPPELCIKREIIQIYKDRKKMTITLDIFHRSVHRGIGYYIDSIPFIEGEYIMDLSLYNLNRDIKKVILKKNWFYEDIKYSFFESKQEIIDFVKLKLVNIPFSEKSKEFKWEKVGRK